MMSTCHIPALHVLSICRTECGDYDLMQKHPYRELHTIHPTGIYNIYNVHTDRLSGPLMRWVLFPF